MIAGLPYGVRKVVELARALASGPKLLLLDEPASGLSVEETQDMAFWIEDIQKDNGVSVLMVEHDMGLVSQVSDRVLAIDHGAMLAMGSNQRSSKSSSGNRSLSWQGGCVMANSPMLKIPQYRNILRRGDGYSRRQS